MAGYKVELCAGCAQDVFLAKKFGAFRVELNSALELSGLTPSMGEFECALGAGIPIIAMIRPRCGGFLYSEEDFSVMLSDARSFTERGASGAAFGFLNEDGSIDALRTRAMVNALGGREAVFHRAFDLVTTDYRSALQTLIEAGVTRVLTSGAAKNALLGADKLSSMRKFVAGAIEILPAGGIRADNSRVIADITGCDVLHSSCSCVQLDPTGDMNTRLSFTASGASKLEYQRTSSEKLEALIKAGM